MAFFTVPPDLPSMPAKKFLRQYCGISLSLWRKIKQTGSIERCGIRILPNDSILPGETLTVTWKIECNIPSTRLPLTIAFEDEYLLIVNKPPGMLVHPTVSREEDTLANAIMYYYGQHHLALGFHPVHRLDRNTSGLILIAKRPDIQHQLINTRKNISRFYQAVICGHPPNTSGTIDAPIDRCPDSIIQRQIAPTGQTAVTHYRLLETFPDASLLELELETGRTHQIRVHLSGSGMPLIGDTLYGATSSLIQRQALHASRIIFQHPISEQLIAVESPLPEDLKKLVMNLRSH
ncbi:MAG TPA: RluA family pseudouridine synthase [Patescibacteria group bacterium]|nr:RluA family pseudouridine synthase [Patescibacteria group bacterium]